MLRVTCSKANLEGGGVGAELGLEVASEFTDLGADGCCPRVGFGFSWDMLLCLVIGDDDLNSLDRSRCRNLNLRP